VAPGDDSRRCRRKTARKQRPFTIEHRFDGTRFRRLTPIPREIT
jgi:hypothetical protein